MACIDAKLTISKLTNQNCKVPGGLDSTTYVYNLSDIVSVTRDATTRIVQTIVLKSGAKAEKWVGRKKAWDSTSESPAGQDTWNQGLGMIYDISTAAEKYNFEKFAAARELVFVVQTNDEKYEIYGLGLTADGSLSPLSGLSKDTASLNKTVETNGETGAVIRFTGEVSGLPLELRVAAGTLAATRTYLEGQLVAAA